MPIYIYIKKKKTPLHMKQKTWNLSEMIEAAWPTN